MTTETCRHASRSAASGAAAAMMKPAFQSRTVRWRWTGVGGPKSTSKAAANSAGAGGPSASIWLHSCRGASPGGPNVTQCPGETTLAMVSVCQSAIGRSISRLMPSRHSSFCQ
jgi:hypothetical protein